MQTILGSGGAVGIPLAKELKTYTGHIRLVARNPVQVNGDDELYATDLTQAGQVDAAVAGSEVVYLTVGLKYDIKTWQKQWPVVMANVIDACIKHGARLVFLDNVYMYSESEIPHMRKHPATSRPAEKAKLGPVCRLCSLRRSKIVGLAR